MEGMTFDERFAMLVDAEWDSRRSNKRVRLLRAASFAEPEANVMDVRYDADRKLDKALYHLQNLARLVGFGVLQQPVIDDEQVALDVALLALERLATTSIRSDT